MSPSSKGTLLGLALCLAVVLAWFSPWWAGGLKLAPLDLQNEMMSPWRQADESGHAKNHIVSDGVDQYLVYRMVAAANYAREGELAWSSLTYGGTEQYANTMALYFDWTMQLHRWFDFWTAWHLGLLGQVLLAACGMFLFLRGRGANVVWSVCGAVAYAANSQFVTWIYHRWALGAFCWVPWILWAIDARRRGMKGAWSLVPLFIGLAFLGGTLQHAALVALVVAAAWAAEAVTAKRDWGKQSRLLGNYAAWGLLGTGLAAMMLLPCADAFAISSRLGMHTGMHGHAEMGVYPQGWLQPFFNLAAYPFQVFPSLLGRCNSVDVLKLFKSELFYIAYFGSLPVIVAFLAPFRRDLPPLARILVIIGLVLPLTPLVRLLYQRLFLLFIVGGILAFVHLMQTATRETRLRLFRWTAWTGGIAIGAWFLLSVGLTVTHDRWAGPLQAKITAMGYDSSFGHFRSWIESRADHFIGDLFIWSPQQALPLLFAILAIAGLRATASLTPRWRQAGSVMVAVAVFAEVTLFATRWIVWSDEKRYPLFPETPESQVLHKEVGSQGRVASIIHPTAHMAITPFVPNTLSAYGIATIHGYDSILPNGMSLVADRTKDPEILGRYGVTHLITFPDNPDVPAAWQPVWKSPSMQLFKNPQAVPRYVGFRDHDALMKFLQTGDRTQYIALEETLGHENSRELNVRDSSWLRVAENYSPGWEFLTDSNWKPVERATDGTMILPLGDHAAHVSMRYRPPLRSRGLAISGISLIACLGIPLFGKKRSIGIPAAS
ncbi:hypothetical protein [Luteolibacter soli]|uniref:Membrane protein 6-pyruvoyl-tetrahydropterin synthase-related domain-containing protein n=1 Tax=Luteolibacter soli TaxID=3135280 RepID=A0ABU9ASX8_9BACT